METKIFILKLKRFDRGGVNGEFSLGNFSFGILVFRNSSFGILEFSASLRGSKATEARNSRFYLKFPTMSSPNLTRGSLCGILAMMEF